MADNVLFNITNDPLCSLLFQLSDPWKVLNRNQLFLCLLGFTRSVALSKLALNSVFRDEFFVFFFGLCLFLNIFNIRPWDRLPPVDELEDDVEGVSHTRRRLGTEGDELASVLTVTAFLSNRTISPLALYTKQVFVLGVLVTRGDVEMVCRCNEQVRSLWGAPRKLLMLSDRPKRLSIGNWWNAFICWAKIDEEKSECCQLTKHKSYLVSMLDHGCPDFCW